MVSRGRTMCGNSFLCIVFISFALTVPVSSVGGAEDDQGYLDTLSQISKETEEIERLLKDHTQPELDMNEPLPSDIAPDDSLVNSNEPNEEDVNEKEEVAELLFHGDMRLSPEQVVTLTHPAPANVSSDLMRNPSNHWPKGQPIPYVFDRRFSAEGKRVVSLAIQEYSQKTCLRFTKRTNQKAYIYFYNGRGCWSFVGRTGGRQLISLQRRGCEHKGIAIHEIMHALGYFHEQSRPDRDNYIIVHFENIAARARNNFKKLTDVQSDNQNTAYDLKSIMHYGTHGFAINRNKPTISVRKRGETIGQRGGLSTIDALSLNKLYCNGVSPSPGPSPSTTTTARPPKGPEKYPFCPQMKGIGLCVRCIVRNKWCPITCGASGGSLRDTRKDCNRIKRYCTSKLHKSYMLRACAKTCGDATSQMRCVAP